MEMMAGLNKGEQNTQISSESLSEFKIKATSYLVW